MLIKTGKMRDTSPHNDMPISLIYHNNSASNHQDRHEDNDDDNEDYDDDSENDNDTLNDFSFALSTVADNSS